MMLLRLAEVDQEAAIRALRQGFVQHGAGLDFQLLLLIAAAVLGVVFVLSRIVRRAPQVAAPEPLEYLLSLARRLPLGRREVETLRTLATASRLSQPACLLLSPGNFAYGIASARRWNENLPHQDLESLCRRLFGTALPGE